MAAIRNFFQKKKLDFKFKDAGKGQKLTDVYSSSNVPQRKAAPLPMSSRAGPSSETQIAALAAITRAEQKGPGKTHKYF